MGKSMCEIWGMGRWVGMRYMYMYMWIRWRVSWGRVGGVCGVSERLLFRQFFG